VTVVAFKYPVGAEVEFKLECDHGDIHRVKGVIVSAFSTDTFGERYVIDYGSGLEISHDEKIVGRINTGKRVKNGG